MDYTLQCKDVFGYKSCWLPWFMINSYPYVQMITTTIPSTSYARRPINANQMEYLGQD
jgi:hypothetical protein